ncbi:MAG TPA: aspartate--tRNA ligase [Rhodospirillales bacterium]|nr:aspartate--tRNA ligase [Rhodospirillales bacterium]
MHPFRTHTCNELRLSHAGTQARLSGWIHRKRDHGNLLFIDLRDHYGLTQCVIDASSAHFLDATEARAESVLTVTGRVVARSAETVNPGIGTGEIELVIDELKVESPADVLPLQVAGDTVYGEETRLRYRFLDLRRDRPHRNITLRSAVIASIRRQMTEAGFVEFQTPILTASSPEGARDYLVPSRQHPGKFYALPQAPQQFKQLLMASGFDRYFQIAPCFRDEDARADRSPGEFYQLDFEMAFATQDDVFAAIEPILHNIFVEFGNGRSVTELPFPRIPYDASMQWFGSDKPDLRNPLVMTDVSEAFRGSSFALFARAVEAGACVVAIPAPGAAAKPRSFFDGLNAWARDEGAGGLGYIVFEPRAERPAASAEGSAGGSSAKGPIAKHLDATRIESILTALNDVARRAGEDLDLPPRIYGDGDAVFFVAAERAKAQKFAAAARERICNELGVRGEGSFRFLWIVDYPAYERNEETGQIEFSHNPFSMPQGGLAALESMDPLSIKAYQYDIVCNGIELSSGAIRNHRPDIMIKAFAIAGYGEDEVRRRFGGLFNAFRYGAPPHGGCAPGIDRIVMMLADEPNIREIIAFPMNQQAQDLLMGAPAEVEPARLKELHIRLELPKAKAASGGGGTGEGEAG